MPLSRRHVLTGLASAGLSGQIGAAGSIAARRLTPLSLRVGVQLYVIGHAPMPGHAALNKLPDDLATLRRIGFREVEGAPPGLSAKDYRRQLDHAGLACPSIHVGLDPSVMGELSLADMSNTTDYAKIVGARNLVVAVLPMRDMLARRPDASELIGDLKRLSQASTELVKSMSASDWTAIAQRLNEAGAKLSRVGLRLGYHNHNAEFTRLPNGRLAYELLVAETDPKLVDFELDLGWARSAGLDPSVIPWLRARDVAVMGSDHPQYVSPGPAGLPAGAIHDFALIHLGLPLFDNCDLEALADAAAVRKRWTFLLTAAPLPIRGGTGSPLNPIATF